jgi:hypothetical protein
MMVILNTNWYSIFYWITVADTVKSVASIIAIVTAMMFAISIVGWFFSTSGLAESAVAGSPENQTYQYNEWLPWVKAWKRSVMLTPIISLIFTLITIFIPSKMDCLLIVAGGAVGNFVTSDSSAKQIPSEITLLLREKIKSEIQELKKSNNC